MAGDLVNGPQGRVVFVAIMVSLRTCDQWALWSRDRFILCRQEVPSCKAEHLYKWRPLCTASQRDVKGKDTRQNTWDILEKLNRGEKKGEQADRNGGIGEGEVIYLQTCIHFRPQSRFWKTSGLEPSEISPRIFLDPLTF